MMKIVKKNGKLVAVLKRIVIVVKRIVIVINQMRSGVLPLNFAEFFAEY